MENHKLSNKLVLAALCASLSGCAVRWDFPHGRSITNYIPSPQVMGEDVADTLKFESPIALRYEDYEISIKKIHVTKCTDTKCVLNDALEADIKRSPYVMSIGDDFPYAFFETEGEQDKLRFALCDATVLYEPARKNELQKACVVKNNSYINQSPEINNLYEIVIEAAYRQLKGEQYTFPDSFDHDFRKLTALLGEEPLKE